MPSTPLVSVVMPVYNGERFVGAAIDSILQQTYRNLECIVVDDGSTDGTPQILEGYRSRDARVQILRNAANAGISATRNRGCAAATGTYIAVMDADDVSLPTRLERQVAYLEAHPDVAAVGAWVHRFDSEGTLGSVHTYPSAPALVAWSMHFFNSMAHPVVMLRRALLDTTQVYSPSYRVAEDYALLFGLSRRHPMANLPEVLLHYRTWPGNITKNSPMEAEAARAVGDVLAAEGVPVADEDVRALQGLSRDRYPSDARRIGEVSAIIVRLLAHFRSKVSRGSDDLAVEDAGIRIWLLALLAVKQSPLAGAGLVARAARQFPGAFVAFAAKVGRRIAGSGEPVR